MKKVRLAAFLASLTVAPPTAGAHPHVFIESNLEVVRDAKGAVTELRHVWRFDELFSSTVLVDFDADGNGELDSGELDEVSSVVTESIGEYDFYTQVRLDGQAKAFDGPERIMVDYVDGQILMFFALQMKEAVPAVGKSLRVAVSDPTYYVAMEIADETAIQISGNGTACQAEIERPDFDKLYAQNSQTLSEQFFNNPDNAGLGDEWLTWVTLRCE